MSRAARRRERALGINDAIRPAGCVLRTYFPKFGAFPVGRTEYAIGAIQDFVVGAGRYCAACDLRRGRRPLSAMRGRG